MTLQLKADVEFANHNEGTNRSKRQGELATLECLATVLTALAGTTSALAAACSLACRGLEVSHTGVPVREDYTK